MANHDEPSTSVERQGTDLGEGEEAEDASVVTNPAELVRVANMLEALMIEVHDLDLDEPGRRRLFAIQHRAVAAIKALVSDDLDLELDAFGLPVEDPGATLSELRIAQAQIVGWLHGLFQGMHAAMFARQMMTVAQLQKMQHELGQSQPGPPGQYL